MHVKSTLTNESLTSQTQVASIEIWMNPEETDLTPHSLEDLKYGQFNECDITLHASPSFLKNYYTTERVQNYLKRSDINFNLDDHINMNFCHVERVVIDNQTITFTLFWDDWDIK